MSSTLERLSITRSAQQRRSAVRLGWIGAGWALSYLPIHLYWAAGGTSAAIGIVAGLPSFARANIAACVVILGAGATCLSLVQPWGALLPYGLRHVMAQVGGVLAIAHAVLYGGYSLVQLAGGVTVPSGSSLHAGQLQGFYLANVGYFEPWFLVMGGLLVACSVAGRRGALARSPERSGRLVAVLLATGVLVTTIGVFAFWVWAFAVLGPVLLTLGLALLVRARRGQR